ncbi:MAG: hypothetical protein ACYTGZ_01700 [Planctomycetota bacterium]
MRKDRVLISFDNGMRSIAKRSVVRAIGDDSKELALDRRLSDAPPERVHELQERIANAMSRAAMDQLVGLTKAKAPAERADCAGRGRRRLRRDAESRRPPPGR